MTIRRTSSKLKFGASAVSWMATAPMCMCQAGVSPYQNAASTPLIRFMCAA